MEIGWSTKEEKKLEREELEVEILTEEEKRELRRRRRKRNQLIARISLLLFIIMISALVAGGIYIIKKNIEKEISDIPTEEVAAEEINIEISMEEEVIEEEVTETQEFNSEQVLDEVISSIISEMTIEEKAAALFIVTPEDITGVDTAVQAGEGTKEAMETYPVGGLVYHKKNIKSEDQLKEMISNSVSYSKYPIFMGIEEEGGEFSPVADTLKLSKVSSMSEVGQTLDSTKAKEAMAQIGTYLSGYGFNLNLGLVADIAEEGGNLKSRSFSADATEVINMTTAALEGMEETGITAAIKYFPGMGSAKDKTSEKVVVIDKSKEELLQKELLPYISLIQSGAEMIMVGHGSYPQISGDNTPASLSREIITDLLRTELGFNGIVITDALNKAAVTEYYGADEAAVKALKAGADMILMPEDFKSAYEGILKAVEEETISEERIDHCLKRIYRVKYKDSVGE